MPSAPILLANYNERAQPGDPTMPCVNVGGCPCWTEAEIDSIGGLAVGVGDRCTENGVTNLDGVTKNPATNGFRDFVKVGTPGGNPVCEYVEDDGPGGGPVMRFLFLSVDAFLICRESIRAECAERGIPLP